MFQSSSSLIHILYDEMSTLVIQFMHRCLTQQAIRERSGKYLEKEENWLCEVNIGEAAHKELKKLRDLNIFKVHILQFLESEWDQ